MTQSILIWSRWRYQLRVYSKARRCEISGRIKFTSKGLYLLQGRWWGWSWLTEKSFLLPPPSPISGDKKWLSFLNVKCPPNLSPSKSTSINKFHLIGVFWTFFSDSIDLRPISGDKKWLSFLNVKCPPNLSPSKSTSINKFHLIGVFWTFFSDSIDLKPTTVLRPYQVWWLLLEFYLFYLCIFVLFRSFAKL